MISSALLKELHAEARTFKTVAGCLLWYASERARRMGVVVPLEVGTAPRSVESRNQADATYAKIANCLVPRHPADWDVRRAVTEQDIEDLLIYYDDEDGQPAQVQKRGISYQKFLTDCRLTRNVIRRRFKDAGLLEELDS